ncbi:MAG: GAF domain-containing protein [Lachnospiraceae bacterium]|nr:GAF domain-containing protein [Lachnospiraceae bacterium]
MIEIADELRSLIDGVEYELSNLANASALIYDAMEGLNWAGFYIMYDGKLRLGPFQGKIACTEIAVGKGVCGTAVAEDRTLVVDNVHEFKGHIACDSASNSEIVIPIHKDGRIYGVLDIDSTEFARFSDDDRKELEKCVKFLENSFEKH